MPDVNSMASIRWNYFGKSIGINTKPSAPKTIHPKKIMPIFMLFLLLRKLLISEPLGQSSAGTDSASANASAHTYANADGYAGTFSASSQTAHLEVSRAIFS
jgi:hypothetical protein